MRGLILIAAAVMLSGCAYGIAGSGSQDTLALFREIMTSTNCGHDDKIGAVVGAAGIPASITVDLQRHCPTPTNIVTVAPGSVVTSTANVKK